MTRGLFLRERYREMLELLGSEEKQLAYERNVPSVTITVEQCPTRSSLWAGCASTSSFCADPRRA